MQCSDTHMLVKGNFVSLREVKRNLHLNNCQNFYYSNDYRKYITIFALNTIFIDEDVPARKFHLIYIAPRWEVLGSRVINLDGHQVRMRLRKKTRNCFSPGSHGEPGQPGVPGSPGGIFLGIGVVFVNGANLTITSNGGDGHWGINGGNGCEGNPGRDVIIPNDLSLSLPLSDVPECCHGDSWRNPNIYEDMIYKNMQSIESVKRVFRDIRLKTENGYGCKFNFTAVFDYYKRYHASFNDYYAYRLYFNLHGTPGDRGGDGGNGGIGGIGGNAGSVEILEINESSEIKTIAINGKNGDHGLGGRAGLGGKDGYDTTAYCFKEQMPCFLCFNSNSWRVRWVRDKQFVHDRRGPRGADGRNGANTDGMKDPDPALHVQEPAKIINEYKGYLRENLTGDFKKFYLTKFYEEMSKHFAVKKLYDTAGLVGEFMDLEDQYYTLKQEVDFYPFYKNLLERIGEYSECTENCDASRDDKIVLSYLYAAVLTKINSLKESTESDLIIDIEKYFDTIHTEISLLQDIENVNSKALAAEEMRKEYKYRIDKKIEEAIYFIENTVNPEINKISRHIDNKIDSLIDAIISSQKKTQIEKNDLESKREELQKTLELKKMLDLIKNCARVISYLIPYGGAILLAIELGTSVGEYFVLDNKEKPIDLSEAAAKINTFENNIKLMRIKRTDYLSNILNELSEEITRYPEELFEMLSKVTDMKNKLSDIRTQNLPFSQIKKLEEELKDILKEKEIDLKSHITEKSSNVIDTVRKFMKAIEVGSMFGETYNKNKGKDEKLDAIDEAIKLKENELTLLREYEEEIYEILRPAFQNIKDKLQVLGNEANKRSQVALDASKWSIQSTLKDISIQMQRIIEKFEVKAGFIRYFEKLEEAISLVITIYDRIQQYQDQQILGNHIANICSVNPSTLSNANQNLVNVTNYLEWSIRSSLVLKNYQTALNAFKQWVFPFSSHYLEGSLPSSGLKPDGNIRNLVFNAAKEIQLLKRKISLYKASAKETDENLIRGEFNCHCISCKPFYVWKDEQFRTEISKLLSGEMVALKADVTHSEPGKDAIKFKSIKLHFKSKNETMQSRLDEALKMFDVSATHIGNSYYRYDDEIYLITSPKRSIIYSFEENVRTGNPVRENEVYIKIREGNLMLSPYTMWILKLNATEKSFFRELNTYKGEVDLELEGKGSYVISNFGHEDGIDSQFETSLDSDLNYRPARSLVQRKRTKRFATSGSGSSLSSPINSICSILKLYTTSLITISFNKILNYGSKEPKIDETSNSLPKTSLNSIHKVSYDIQERNISNREFHRKSIDPIHKNDLTLEDPDLKGINMLRKYNIATNIDTTAEFNYCKQQAKPFILNEREGKCYNHSIQVPDLNFSLLFADFIARSVTGVKYETGMDESLMSPKQVIFKRCDESSVKYENDIMQNLRLFSEMEENKHRSWFFTAKHCIKSVFKSFRFPIKEEYDEYVRDIKHLFD